MKKIVSGICFALTMDEWACENCGHQGVVPTGETIDMIQCDACGEPVTPIQHEPTRVR